VHFSAGVNLYPLGFLHFFAFFVLFLFCLVLFAQKQRGLLHGRASQNVSYAPEGLFGPKTKSLVKRFVEIKSKKMPIFVENTVEIRKQFCYNEM
jgi:hypothetical protein